MCTTRKAARDRYLPLTTRMYQSGPILLHLQREWARWNQRESGIIALWALRDEEAAWKSSDFSLIQVRNPTISPDDHVAASILSNSSPFSARVGALESARERYHWAMGMRDEEAAPKFSDVLPVRVRNPTMTPDDHVAASISANSSPFSTRVGALESVRQQQPYCLGFG
jgi:hypothetical protein